MKNSVIIINGSIRRDGNTDIISEILILASPLYWCSVTGLMKTFIDRLFFYYHPHNRKLVSGKKAIIVTPMNQKDVTHESDILVEFYRRLFNCLDIEIIGMEFFGGLMEKGSVLKWSEYLQRAYTTGRGLGKWITLT